MLSIIDVVNLVKTIVPEAKVYPLEFPIDSPDLSIVVNISGSTKAQAGLFAMNVQVRARAEHPSVAEFESLKIRKGLQELTNVLIKDVQVVFIEPTSPFPIFIGKDGNANFLYSTNYRFMINEGE